MAGGFVGMEAIFHKLLTAALLVLAFGISPFAYGGYRERLHLTSIEAAQLPKFCWAQMEVPGAKGPEYEFPPGCGPAMNHYCEGLVNLIRAKHAVGKTNAIPLLRLSENSIQYTENGMKDYASCPIRGHVESSKAEVRNLLTIYGAKPSATK
jgi:hypothetical protein